MYIYPYLSPKFLSQTTFVSLKLPFNIQGNQRKPLELTKIKIHQPERSSLKYKDCWKKDFLKKILSR